ncbi:hypothetical protein EO241_21560 [Escherichia coli]|nr:hypothetical protein [Salmonella enterica subsp. enterica serovar Minnesota]RXB03604.1 hypothetical protein EO241_21560 [Escherichia coli]EAB8446883.1 hypothetical protein [Salmonella enterica subsp. enterica serovar Minnesota]EBX8184630.1 hypothetical protein [Salmonella enterica subsp. enterica serovar Minnesota]EBZ2004457.1 hypothetical protein [Salmonella enterica subsp. enterica serovar Minnesota]
MQKIHKIDNGWKSFNTHTIESSPANRARSCIRHATVSFISDRKLLIQCRYTNIIDDRHLLARNA